MSYKKLRLDPETPIQGSHRNLSNPLGATDNGRGFLDNSSFSSSTSGGSGPLAGSAAPGPYRTRYSNPLHLNSPHSLSRFAPYYFGKERRSSLKVPLIRARRDDSETGFRSSSRLSLNSSIGGGDSSHALATTSTAQRIIETLQNISTPVMNAGKIRIDQDIKAVQPMSFGAAGRLPRYSHGSALSRSTGPPKMCSSLLLSNPSSSNQVNPVSNFGDQRRVFYIPKMIDAATNTDKDVETISPGMVHQKLNKIDESKSSTPTSSKYMGGGQHRLPSKDDNSDEEFHECSSDFTFSSAWSTDIFDNYFSNDKEDKNSSNSGSQSQPSLPNGYKEPPLVAPPPSSSHLSASLKGSTITISSSPGSSTNLSFTKSSTPAGPNFGFGTSSSDDAPSTRTTNSGGLAASSSTKPYKFENLSAAKCSRPTPSFSFGKDNSGISNDNVDAGKNNSSFAGLKPSSSEPSIGAKWRCPACFVENQASAPTCVCCTEKKPNSTGNKPLAPIPSTENVKKWRCPICMVENKIDLPTCACCSEKNPNYVPGGTATTPSPAPTNKWRCPTCMVENDAFEPACVCCSEKNPSGITNKNPKADAGSASVAPAFKFGLPSNSPTTSSTPAANSSFVFGQPASSSTQASSTPTFKFGAPTSAASTTTTSTTSSPSLSATSPAMTAASPFGSSSVPVSTSTSTPFKFGESSTASTSADSKSTLGFSTSTEAPTTATTTTTSSNMFGAQKSTDGVASQSMPGFNFGTSSNDIPKTNTGFTFGSSSEGANSTFTFGNGASQSSTLPTTNTQSSTTVGGSTSGFGGFGTGKPITTTASGGFNFTTSKSNADTPKTTPIFGSTAATTNFSGFGSGSQSGLASGQPSAPTIATTSSTGIFGSSNVTTAASTPNVSSMFGSSTQSAPAFNFGATTSTTTANIGPPKPAASGFNFSAGASTAPKSFGTGFNFTGTGGSQPQQPTTQAPGLSSPTGPAFGGTNQFNFAAGNPGPGSSFGQTPANPPSQPPGLFQFGGTPAAPTFNQTPNFNFGAATPTPSAPSFGGPTQPAFNVGSPQAPNPLFSFNATPTDGRKIKQARRRQKK